MGIVGPSRNFTSIFGSSRTTTTSTRETALVVGLQIEPASSRALRPFGPNRGVVSCDAETKPSMQGCA
jgi:hypothetical protein